jgi:hypothetical protein
VFRAQSDELLVLPLIALGIFLAVYAVRVVGIARTKRDVIRSLESMPLEKDTQ